MVKYHLIKLKNNLTVFLIQTKKLSSLDLTLYIKAGSTYETKANSGISHLLEHLLFLRTREPEFYPLGLDIYPFTRKDFTYFEVNMHKYYLKEILRILSSVIIYPEFNKDSLERIKKIVAEELVEFYSDPYNVLNQKIDEYLYKNNSLSLSIGGTKESIDKLGIGDLETWYSEFYIPERMILTVVGDIRIDQTVKMINEFFVFKNTGDKHRNIVQKPDYCQIPRGFIKVRGNNLQQSYLSFVFPMAGISSPKYINHLLLSEIINRKLRLGMRNSEFFYDMDFDCHTYLTAGELRIIIGCNKNNIDKIRKEFDKQLQRIEITERFFNKIKEYFKLQFSLKEDNTADLSSLTLYLLNDMSQLLTIDDEVKKIQNIKLNKLRRAQKKIFNKRYYCFLMSP